VVGLLFGAQWQAATPYVACFAVAAMTLPVTLSVGLLYQSQNRPADLLRAAVLDAAAVAVAILAGVSFGPLGIAIAYATAGLLLRLPTALWLGGRRGPVGSRDLIAAILPSLAAAAVVAAGVALLRWSGVAGTITALPGLALSSLVAMSLAFLVFCAIPRSRRVLGILRRLPHMLRHGPTRSSVSEAGE
jgi:PST family polysaccharide transporter